LEFGLLIPFLIIVITGLIDYSHYFSAQICMVTAVRAGARAGAAQNQDDGPEDAAIMKVLHDLSGGGVEGQVEVTASLSDDPFPNQVIVVTASADRQPLIGMVPQPNTIGSQWSMRMEDQPDIQVDTGI
jgi:Flp pilus assembly protein TadG